MLKNVHLKNLALIKEADIDYENGLNIMTGETGSGKSIIISSINIALGDKANKGLIRRGCDQGLVELTFVSDSPNVHAVLNELGIEEDGNNITITRKITQDSAISKVNGETVTLANIKRITAMLVDIHGQHDHQSLLNPVNHIEILDKFGSDSVSALKSAMKEYYESFRAVRNEYRNYNMDEAALAREVSLLEFELKEIEDAGLTAGEDDRLEKEYKQLGTWEKLSDSLQSALMALNDEGNGASAGITKALTEISYSASSEPENESFKTFKGTLMDLDSVTKDLCHDINKYISEHRFDRERYNVIRERLNLINRLKSKYGSSVTDIIQYGEKTADKLKQYKDYSATRDELLKKMSSLRSELNKTAQALSAVRMKTAEKLAAMITDNLKELNFLSVDFRIDFKKNEKISENGYDKVEFLISLNPGETVKPLAKIASGGELSRIMLAIKSSVAEKDDIPTLIFDEIDTGISGKTAQMVARKLRSLGQTHQIICITHLPQIAAMADSHFSIHKEVEDGATISGIEKLGREQEIEELARLLSGEVITEATLQNARELKAQANGII